ncbi:MAG: HAD-IIA family hydrolase, partial [Planctomycetota bacterium]
DRLEIGRTFLTNNSSRSTQEYADRLGRLGIDGEVHTSTLATIAYLRRRMPDVKRLFVLGTPSLRGEMRDAGYELCEESPDDRPDAVLVGFDMTLDFVRLCRAGYWIERGTPFLATHPDRTCPTDEPTLLVDCGALVACLESATGRTPIAMPGKPDPWMLECVLRKHGLEASQLAMVGDRIYTDLELARRASVLGVLVLSGEATRAQAEADPPDLVVENLEELGKLLREARGR